MKNTPVDRVKFSVQRGYLAQVQGRWVRITRSAYYRLRVGDQETINETDILSDQEESTAKWLARHRGRKS